jgi:hypothetical protein
MLSLPQHPQTLYQIRLVHPDLIFNSRLELWNTIQRLPTLPLEVIAMVLSCVDNTPTLAACALTCLALHDFAIPLLYHTVCLGERQFTSKVGDIALFLHGVLASTTDEKAFWRKTTYLCHLKALVLHARPRQKHILTNVKFEGPLPLPSLYRISPRTFQRLCMALLSFLQHPTCLRSDI